MIGKRPTTLPTIRAGRLAIASSHNTELKRDTTFELHKLTFDAAAERRKAVLPSITSPHTLQRNPGWKTQQARPIDAVSVCRRRLQA